MKIKSIVLEHTNPSLGPHEVITEVTLVNSKDHTDRINRFLQEAQVNGVVTLYEYIEAIKTQDSPILEQVWQQAPNEALNEGETISNLEIHFEDDSVIRLDDVYRRFSLTSFYQDFTVYMVEKGTLIRYKPDDLKELEMMRKVERKKTR